MERPKGGASIQSGFGKIFSVAEIRRRTRCVRIQTDVDGAEGPLEFPEIA
jgi:hypothetical protein